MSDPTKIFHAISYLQYPLMVVAFGFYVLFVISLIERPIDWGMLNYMLIFLGVGLSFSTLQDTTTTQNKISKRVWQDPRKGKALLVVFSVSAIVLIVSGIWSLFALEGNHTESVSIGLTVLGIGVIGLLKVALEMFENHRLDKKQRTFTIDEAN